MSTIVLAVQGMTCNHCVKSVEKAVGSLEGVKEVNVTLAGGKVEVKVENNTSSAGDIAQSIEDQGFTVVSTH